jgi:hypothetical protein
MSSGGSLSINEKIYLSNKTLVEVKNLKVGDKILSLKVKDDEIKDIVDIYKKYIIQNKPIENFEVSESEVYSISINNEKITPFIELNKSPINHYKYIAVDYKTRFASDFMLQNAYTLNIIDEEYKRKIRKLNPSFSTENLENLEIFIDYDYSKNKNKEYHDSSIKIDIADGHFYFTENFVIFAGNGK